MPGNCLASAGTLPALDPGPYEALPPPPPPPLLPGTTCPVSLLALPSLRPPSLRCCCCLLPPRLPPRKEALQERCYQAGNVQETLAPVGCFSLAPAESPSLLLATPVTLGGFEVSGLCADSDGRRRRSTKESEKGGVGVTMEIFNLPFPQSPPFK
ncbi:Hypothetical predicted protein [Podarcis lilfordi]|uniref:Uncharacterized protein n=1 Tax=Podarcis lilfordi TaxID=74358 RepID=A0AA35P9K2_9SAUR|nr:Hypothetical predicted protein [Podarcis lilfordi]